jgi:hypothetical protein
VQEATLFASELPRSKNRNAYQKALDRLLRDLRVEKE